MLARPSAQLKRLYPIFEKPNTSIPAIPENDQDVQNNAIELEEGGRTNTIEIPLLKPIIVPDPESDTMGMIDGSVLASPKFRRVTPEAPTPAPVIIEDTECNAIAITDYECPSVPPSSPDSVEVVNEINEGASPHNPSSPDSVEVVDEISEGASSHNPIVLVSPIRPTLPLAGTGIPRKTLAPIFTIRQGKVKAPDPERIISPRLRRNEKSLPTPFPTDESQHIRGPQTLFSASGSLFKRKNKDRLVAPGSERTSLSFLASESLNGHIPQPMDCLPDTSDSDRENYLNTIPEDSRSHPAVANLLRCASRSVSATPAPSPSQRAWTDKWRPTHADRVLGNEQHALYLRDWLRALELQLNSGIESSSQLKSGKGRGKINRGIKRPRVLRAVDKQKRRKKQRSDELDWIVNSSDEDDDEFDDESDGEQSFLASLSKDDTEWEDTAHHYAPQEPDNHIPFCQKFDGILTNTIILTGPPGCGKTAAVYACASELNWEVLAVYPGIGKRNSSSLENLVGEVGKNHMIGRTHLGRDSSVNEFFTSGKRARETPTSTDDFGFVTTPNDPTSTLDVLDESSRNTTSVRQSMVLLEEVDILYKEDTGFWAAVVKLIKDCRRPVIMTCNDISLVPIDDLPLQSIRVFEPCPPPLAVAYLQSLCLAEDYLVGRDDLFHLYQNTYRLNSLDISDMPAANFHSDCLPTSDLRRAINHLQFWSSAPNKPLGAQYLVDSQDVFEDAIDWNSFAGSIDNPSEKEGTRATQQLAVRHAELMSFINSNLSRNDLQSPEVSASGRWPCMHI
jgi:ATPase family associated with various cellular activities (AAA)